LVCKDGVVIVADRRIRDKLIAAGFVHKIFEVDEHIVASAAGILSDARVLIDDAQVLAQQHRVTYNSPIDPIAVIKMIADKKQVFTQYGGSRPYGVAMLLAGVNRGRSHLYTSDVTGNFFSYRANAIGENDEQIKEQLRSEFTDDMSIDEGIKFALGIFKKILGKNFEIERFEATYIKQSDPKLVRLHSDSLKKYVR
jgi:proteasome alpha subunit